MEREIVLTGIGGQSVQLAAQILARAAALERRDVLMLGTFGGTMRGGNTESTLIIGDGPLETPPIVSHVWAALVMHHAFFEPVCRKLRPGGVVVVNSALFEGDLDRDLFQVFDVPATQIAAGLGQPLAASLVLVGAFTGLTGVVALESLVEAMSESVPSYRRQHLETNEKALRAGFESVGAGAAPAWAESRRAG